MSNHRSSHNSSISTLTEQHYKNPEDILEIFQDVEIQSGYINQDSITQIARQLKLPPSKVYGVASFYSMLALAPRPKNIIRLCDGPVCWLCGSDSLRSEVETAFSNKPNWTIERSSCLGLCDRAPAALVNNNQVGPLKSDNISAISDGWLGEQKDYSPPVEGEKRAILARAGIVDPDSLESALEHGAYQALARAFQRKPEEIVTEVEKSGLTGRGGAGFPVGRKWRYVAEAAQTPKYVICNADESEPLIFKDRVLMDTDPHQILEGMAIAGYATGAQEAYIYIRGEYISQASRLKRAIKDAESANWLGTNIQGSDFSFNIHVHTGAGAYICGEETALIESLEGKRGEPRLRPPYPPTFGFRGLPTLVNNVESLAAIPSIILNGSDWYRSLSNADTPGTKIYLLLGHVNRPRLFEAPFGLTLRQVIDEFGGGMCPGSTFKLALTGGAAGTIVDRSLLDTPIDYSSVGKGISLGAGAFFVCDQTVSTVALLRNLLHFFAIESCGKCTPCRVGTYRALEILNRMVINETNSGDYNELLALADNLQEASFCGLGQSIAIPMKSALAHFADEFKVAKLSNMIHQ